MTAPIPRPERTLTGVAPAAAVDDARLQAASNATTDWLTYGHTYENQRFSTLDQINTDTVSALAPRWIYQTGISATFLASPVVADGVMYLSTPLNDLVALDAVTGAEKWRYHHEMKIEKLCCGPANRGVSLGYGAVYMATADGRLIALDMATGAVRWDIFMAVPDTDPTETVAELADDDPWKDRKATGQSGLGANMAPLVFDGMVIAGVTGAGYGLHVDHESGRELGAVIGFQGNFGRRGYLAAYDAENGAEIWRWYTTKETGWEGDWVTETADGAPLFRDIAAEKARMAEYGGAWAVGGGSLWSTPALDPELGILYMGTGNPSPQMDDVSRPGDNLYTVSVVAIDVHSGKLRWYYQQVPHDLWGYDTGSPPVLFDVEHDGRHHQGGRRSLENRMVLRQRPDDRRVAVQVRRLCAPPQPIPSPRRGRGDDRARRRRRHLVVAGLLRSGDRARLYRRYSHADDVHRARTPGDRRQAGAAILRSRDGRRAELGRAQRDRHPRERPNPLADQDRGHFGRRRVGDVRRSGVHGPRHRRILRLRFGDR